MMPPQHEFTYDWAARVSDTVPEIRVVLPESEDQARLELPEADAAFGTVPANLLKIANKLRWIQAPAAAPPAGYYYDALIEHPVEITNFREIYNDHISTQIMAYVLMFARGMDRYFPQQLRREYRSATLDTGVVHLPDSTAVIIGVGGIGAETARHCSHFGMRVIGIDARREKAPEGVTELHTSSELDHILPQADFVIMTIPHTPQTERLMNAEKFSLMKKSAFLINIGRGMTVNLDDLVNALRLGDIGGAALDVYEIEPLPPEHPLWGLPNTILTPHTAGFGPYLNDRRARLLIDNARRFASGQPLRNIVDKKNWF